MRYLLTFSTLLFVFNLCAEHISDTDKTKETEGSFNSSANDFEGGYCGLGVNIGMQKTSATGNREFKNASESAYSSTFGGVAAIGYQKVLCGNCFIGAEVGVDFGSGPKRLRVGGQLNENSAGFGYLRRQYAISQVFSSHFRVLSPYLIPTIPLNSAQIDGNVWRNFLKVNRYLGGSNDAGLANPDGTPGAAIANFVNGAYRALFVDPGNEPLASYFSFLEQDVANSLSLTFGRGNPSLALRELRNFIVASNPDLANTLRSIGENDIGGLAGSNINGALALVDPQAIIRLLSLFTGSVPNFNDIGIANAALFGGDINRVNNAIRWAFSGNFLENATLEIANISKKSSFGVSLYLALKVGYFYDEIKTCLYAKIGITQLNGYTIPASNIYGLQNEKFNKITPFAALGVMRNINNNWGIIVEISHAFKTKKKLRDIEIFGHRIKNNVEISRSDIRIMATYSLR
ncbi:MAG: hypothetical protein LBJ96_02470 [Holosporaceae bacterium]|jgi:hypothetical protein|nr:hypothetical protein [Holosporaceae bacterium]